MTISPLSILYHDAYLVVVNKPSGMLVHRSWLDKGETRFVMQTLRDQIGQHVYPLHRLDKPTSGVLVFALSSKVASQMMPQFAEARVKKNVPCYCTRLGFRRWTTRLSVGGRARQNSG